MPEYRTPGVYIEEIAKGVPAITGGELPATAFVGNSGTAAVSDRLSSSAELATACPAADANLVTAARVFFDNGGTRLHVAPDVEALATLDGVGVVAAPGRPDLAAALIAHVEAPDRYRFALLDPPPGLGVAGVLAFRGGLASDHAALFWPWATAAGEPVAPSACVAGVMARTDERIGLWKSFGGEALRGLDALAHVASNAEQDVLGQHRVNVLRSLPARGLRVWGMSTLSIGQDGRYITVRRLLDWLESAIVQGSAWAVFEPADEATWSRVRQLVENFLTGQWRAGALAGQTAREAFWVRCDRTTMTASDISEGRLVIEVGVAPLRPAEFVVLRLDGRAGRE